MSNALKKLILSEIKKIMWSIENPLLIEGFEHLQKLKPHELLKFMKRWNLDKEQFHISEKVDGSNMAFGLKEGEFYVRSRNYAYFKQEEIPSIFFMKNYEKYFINLKKVPWNQIFSELSQKYNFEYDGNFEVEGEAIASYDHNIILYDEAKIGEGVYVIFNTKTGFWKDKTGIIRNEELWKDIAERANLHSPIKFFTVAEVSLDELEFDNDLIVSLEGLIEKHGNILAKVARSKADKEIKSQILAKIQKIADKAKAQALEAMPRDSMFGGEELEGLVIRSPEGDMVKIVDPKTFLEPKKANWHYLNLLRTAEMKFKRALKKNPSDLQNLLEDWANDIEDIEREFFQNGKATVSIPKKREDTKLSMDFARRKIKKMKQLVNSGQTPEEVANAFISRTLQVESKNRKLTEVNLDEGGRAVNANSAVPREWIVSNVNNALQMSNFSKINFELVGNKTKKLFNDIDIAVDLSELVKQLNLPEGEKNFWDSLKRHLENSQVENFSFNKGLKQFHVEVPLVDENGNQANAISPNGIMQDEPGIIQIDFLVGDINWMKDINSGAPKESNYKAIYRNMLLYSIASIVQWTEEGEEENEYWKYSMNFREGFKRQKIKVVPPTGRQRKPQLKKIFNEVITTSSDDLAMILFGEGTKWEDMNSFEELLELLLSDKFRFKQFLPEILENYKASLTQRKMEIPEELS